MRLIQFLCCFFIAAMAAAQPSRTTLMNLLGRMPEPPELHVDTLERTPLEGGWRYRVRYLSEDSDRYFHTPKDFIYAYIFMPSRAAFQPLPAIIAIHQDGAHNYLGAAEVAGIRGDPELQYGLELFRRGYIVICPDRFLHASRRRIARPDTLADVFEEADLAEQHWTGQLLLSGRTAAGKEVYDLERTMDLLYSMPAVDKKHIGAIGHSAGGYVLGYFMCADPRVKVGASSCGVFEMADWYDEKAARKRNAAPVMPGLVPIARTSDYIGYIAPRPFLMTRGLWEWGSGNEKEKAASTGHVQMTKRLEAEARKYYQAQKADAQLKTIYFDEAGGNHAFPPKVKASVYTWLDQQLKTF